MRANARKKFTTKPPTKSYWMLTASAAIFLLCASVSLW